MRRFCFARSNLTTPSASPPRRRRLFVGAVVAVVALVAALVVLLVQGLGGNNHAKPATLSAVPSDVQAAMSTIPATTYEQVGVGEALTQGVPMSTGVSSAAPGKPTLLFISAQYCPFCAGQRWALVAALSRFGTFSGLSLSESEEYHVATFSFLHTTFHSRYLNFVGRDVEDQTGHALQKLTPAQAHTWDTYLSAGEKAPSFPFIDFGGRYVSVNDTVDVTKLLGLPARQIATEVREPSTSVSQTVIGAANMFTAAICQLTNQQPASVCTANLRFLAGQFPAYRR